MEPASGISIRDHFSTLSDPRILRKTRHKLVDVIVITLCAVIAGADDWVEIAAFGKEKEQWFKTFLELPGGIPSHDTFGRVFSLINPEEFGKCFVDWIRSAFPFGESDILVLDQGPMDRAPTWLYRAGLDAELSHRLSSASGETRRRSLNMSAIWKRKAIQTGERSGGCLGFPRLVLLGRC